MNATQLIAGYTAYTTAEEFGATAQGDAPATTPILSVIDISSAACGAAVSAVSAASVGATAHVGC
ncbi:LxmA leader domain family RiPP [Streptomyces sp. NPDC127112]|uniref:LxmA leader domain family RiPP n=1 Tax=Streptomyces sp. NPDC127112 TaxID=3345364 RepID=UPI00364230C6